MYNFIVITFAILFTFSAPLLSSDPQYPETEITIQTQGASSSQTTTFEFIPLTALLSRDASLNYYSENTLTQVSSLIGNVRCSYDGFEIRFYGEGDEAVVCGCGAPSAGIKPMRYGFYKLIIKVDNVYKTHFYYDIREGNFPGGCNGNDITVRYDVGENKIYIADNGTEEDVDLDAIHITWIEVQTGEVLLYSIFKKCVLRDFSPFWETNGLAVFSEKGSANIAVPNLYWGPYHGFTPEYYKIFWSRVPAGNSPGNFTFLAQVDGQTTSYLHEGTITGSGWTAYYKVKAISGIQESNYTNIGEVNVTNMLFKKSENNNLQDITLNNKHFNLAQNFPNPFNPITEISFSLPSDQNVRLDVFDVRGTLIHTFVKSYLPAGDYTFSFNGSSLPSGVYYYRLVTSSHSVTKRMLLIK